MIVDRSQTLESHGMQRICNKILNMTAFIHITLLCPKHFGALKWGGLCVNTAVISTW